MARLLTSGCLACRRENNGFDPNVTIVPKCDPLALPSDVHCCTLARTRASPRCTI